MNPLTQQWHLQFFDHFVNLVRSPDGDFESIEQLANDLNQPSSLKALIEKLSQNLQGKQAFQQPPRLGYVNLQQLHHLPPKNLGYHYAEHVTRQVIQQDLTPFHENPLQANSDAEFLVAHIRETHEPWHLLTGFSTTIIGEIQLQAFYAAQLHGYRFWLALLAKNLLKSAVFDLDISEQYMDTLTQGWRIGKQAKSLLGIEWSTQWGLAFHEVQA
jgi:ubiquinone biosynthesis protein COQ4